MILLQAGSLCYFIVLHDVSAAFDSSPRGYRRVQPNFAHRHRVPRAPARCPADLVPLAVAQSSMAWPPACGDALWAQEEEMSVGALVHRLLNPLGFVAFKMGRLRGGRKEHIWIDT